MSHLAVVVPSRHCEEAFSGIFEQGRCGGEVVEKVGRDLTRPHDAVTKLSVSLVRARCSPLPISCCALAEREREREREREKREREERNREAQTQREAHLKVFLQHNDAARRHRQLPVGKESLEHLLQRPPVVLRELVVPVAAAARLRVLHVHHL